VRTGLTEEETAYVLDPKAVYGEEFPGETFRVLKANERKKGVPDDIPGAAGSAIIPP